MRLAAHLLEDRFGDVVVAAPVGGALGAGELVEVVAAEPLCRGGGLIVERAAVVDEVAVAAIAERRWSASIKPIA